MILRTGTNAPSLLAASRAPVLRRSFVSAVPALRQVERLPPGHVRPRRRPISRPLGQDSPYQAGGAPGGYSGGVGGPGGPGGPGGFQIPFGAEAPEVLNAVHVPSRPVSIPNDPTGTLQESHAARDLLGHETLVIVRQIEMLNIFMGFEQANRYAIQTPEGEVVGFMAEEETTMISAMSRQFLRTHRPFKAVIMDRTGKPILWIRRPFQFINSKIFVSSAEGEQGKVVGEAQQEWHPWRRRYNVFQNRETDTFSQFARIDSGIFAWDFWLKDKDDRLVASINRNFRGLGRELFTDTGQYVIRFDSAGTELDMPPGAGINVQGQSLILPEGKEGGLTLDQRAMTLATAVSIDFDYFSRHSGAGGMGFPFMMWGGGDGSSDVARGGQSSDVGAAGTAGAVGAAGAMGQNAGSGRQLSEDEQVYGPASDQPVGGQYGDAPVGGSPGAGGQAQGWADEPFAPDGEDVMEDPWTEGPSDGGWFGGGSGGGGGGGDWGDFGDWS